MEVEEEEEGKENGEEEKEKSMTEEGKGEEESEEESEESEESEDGRDRTKSYRIWALENLYKLVMTANPQNTFALIRLLFVVGCFQTQDEPKQGKEDQNKRERR